MEFDDIYSTAKFLVQYGIIPRYFYRFTTIIEKSDKSKLSQRFIDSIVDGKLYFSHPDSFNDPFDCNITLNTDNTNEEKLALINTWERSNRINQEQKAHLINVYSNPESYRKIVLDSISKAKDSITICCFSKIYDNILLWSHYADSHKGICFKFDFLKSPEIFMTPFHVKYLKKYPKLNYLRHSNKTEKVMIESKSKDWKYEKEIRIFKRGKPGYHTFNKDSLEAIIFGCKCEDSIIREVINLTQKSGYNISSFFKAQVSEIDYKLLFNKIDI